MAIKKQLKEISVGSLIKVRPNPFVANKKNNSEVNAIYIVLSVSTRENMGKFQEPVKVIMACDVYSITNNKFIKNVEMWEFDNKKFIMQAKQNRPLCFKFL